jgi:hypothetical protein
VAGREPDEAVVVAVTLDVAEMVKEVEAKHKTIETNAASVANKDITNVTAANTSKQKKP